MNQRGFTLVEILVATTMLTLLLGVLFTTFYTTVRAWDRADQYAIQANDIEAVQRFLRSRIAAAKPVAYPVELLGPRGSGPQITFVGGPDHLAFVAPSPAHRGTGGQYLFVVGTEGNTLRLDYRIYHPRMTSIRPHAGPAWTTMTLLDDVARIRFRYLGQPHDDIEAGWHTSWPNAERLPILVEMHADRSGPRELPWPPLLARTMVERSAGRWLSEGFGIR